MMIMLNSIIVVCLSLKQKLNTKHYSAVSEAILN